MADIKISDLSKLLKLGPSEVLLFLEKSGIKGKGVEDTLNNDEKTLVLETIKAKPSAGSQNRLSLDSSQIKTEKNVQRIFQNKKNTSCKMGIYPK